MSGGKRKVSFIFSVQIECSPFVARAGRDAEAQNVLTAMAKTKKKDSVEYLHPSNRARRAKALAKDTHLKRASGYVAAHRHCPSGGVRWVISRH